MFPLILPDGVTTTELAALILAIVAVLKPFVPNGPRQNDIIRLGATLLGAIVVPVAVLTAPHLVVTPAIVFGALASGIAVGAGLTFSVAGAKAAPALVRRVASSGSNSTQPVDPSVNTPPAL